jgi:hypothetical protein
MDELNSEGFVNALISLKKAPKQDEKSLRSTFGYLEKLMVDNLHAFDLETMAQILLAFNDNSSGEVGKIPIQGVDMRFQSPHQKLMASFEERLASRGQGE